MYFEEELVFSESTRRAAVGVIYFALSRFFWRTKIDQKIGTMTCCVNLSILSVLPDIFHLLPPHYLSFFAFQLFANIGVAASMGIPVPYMLAVNKPYFMNEILSKAPAALYTTAAVTAGALQFWSGIHKNLITVFPVYTLFIFSNTIVGVVAASCFVFAVMSVIDLDHERAVMTFSVDSSSWNRSPFEHAYYATSIAYVSLLSLMFYALSICDLLYKVIYMTPTEVDAEEPETAYEQTPKARLIRMLLHLITDTVYVVIILVPSYGTPVWTRVFYDTVRIYGLIFWPTIAATVHTPFLAKALKMRIKIVLLACCGPGNKTNPNGRKRRENRMRITV